MSPGGRLRGGIRRHRLLLVLLGAGLVLRVLAWLAYRPALLYTDSFRYLENLRELAVDQLNPIGYDLVLRPLLAVGGLPGVTAAQHLAGLVLGAGVYALALRHGARTWVAALAAAPVLLDAYQLQIEQNVMAEVTFQVLLLGIVGVLLVGGAPGWKRAAVAGLLVGAAVVVRSIGLVLVVPLVIHLVVAGSAWRTGAGRRRVAVRTVAGLAGFAVVCGWYAAYTESLTGRWAISGASVTIAYGRAAVVADCEGLDLDETQRRFCPPEPLGQRKGVDDYAHQAYGDPNWPGPLPPGRSKEQLAREFSRIVFRSQPLDIARAVLVDFGKNFALTRSTTPGDVPLERWHFQTEYPQFADPAEVTRVAREYGGSAPAVARGPAGFLRAYQLGGGYTSGALLGLGAVLGLAGAAGLGRARQSGRARRSGRTGPTGRSAPGSRSAALLAAGSGLVLLLGSAAFEFSWRYQLPALVLLPLAGALGYTALTGPAGRRTALADYPDEVDAAAAAEFDRRYDHPRLAPVVVVIAAYHEADGIGAVLRDLPTRCHDLPVDVLVVVDGGGDDTATVAADHGAYVCAADRNRGQGAALRLGYRLAAAGGAAYVVTTDADGQYDNAELPALLRPILDGDADFVTGSRRLGHEETDSRVRWLGVRVFAALASVLTWRRITDTSFGFRAIRAELACAVTLREPQYQSSELLLGVLARGARVVELPMTMRLRSNGASKKGRSLVYGANYARVMTGTWFREYVLRRWRTRTGRRARTSAGT